MALTTSIAMATYNGAMYIEEQLDSFAEQSQLPDELVICDDGSSDGTVEICERFAAVAPFPVIIHQNDQNLGYTRNFEQALARSAGDVVFISDQDDVWYADKISTVTETFRGNPQVDLVIHDLEYCDANLRRTGQTKIARVSAVYEPQQSYVTGMATAVRQRFLKLCLPFPIGLDTFGTYDNWLHSVAVWLGSKMVLNQLLADYRRHGVNVTATTALNDASSVDADAFRRSVQKDRYLVPQFERLKHKLQFETALLDRLRSQESAYGFPHSVIERMETAVSRYSARVSALSVPRRKRLPLLARLYRSGVYDEFSGFKSFLKDLLFRQTAR